MIHPQTSLRSSQQRKFMLMLPVLVLPFVIILFALLGGGKESDSKSSSTKSTGLNVKLPDAHFKKGADKSKLTLYDEVSRDSIALKEKIKNDPYYFIEHQDSIQSKVSSSNSLNENEAKIIDKLAQLKSVIRKKEELPQSSFPPSISSNPETEQLEKLLANHRSENIHDPKMDQLNSMLDKVMAIQHPEILSDSLARMAKEIKEVAYRVDLNNSSSDPQTFGSENSASVSPSSNRFYDLASDQSLENVRDNTIEAEIPETQTLVSGSTIKLRLLNDVRINGHLIVKDQLIYGIVTLSGERLKIGFSSIRAGKNILPVSLEAYDLDGLAGIYIPGSINRDVAKQSSDQAISSMNLATLDPSIGAQAAGAGIQAAKSLISRKVKLVKVTVKAGYKMLLRDSKYLFNKN